MFRFRRRFTFALRAAAIWLFASSTPAQDASPLDARINAALKRAPDGSRVAVSVLDARSGVPLFERSADVPLRPASALKLLTTAAALEYFGPDFAFETQLLHDRDELWVIASGDPGLGDPRLAARNRKSPAAVFDEWAESLRRSGISRLEKLVIDDSIFDDEFRHPDWPAEQSQRWYAAPVGGANVNDNCLDSRAVVQGSAVTLILTPELPAMFIDNRLSVGRQRASVSRGSNGDVFTFAGTLSRSSEFGPVSAGHPTVFFGHALREALSRRGIEINGDVVRRAIPSEARSSARLVARHVTPLSDVLWRANNFSQNLFAECLLKSLAAYDRRGRSRGIAGSWDDGARVARETLASMGIGLAGAVWRDGSGLSHKNRLTARQLAGTLRRMRSHPSAAIFADSLARPGLDGTLRRRLADLPDRVSLRAKTGSLNGVSALCGYLNPAGATSSPFAAPTPTSRNARVAAVTSLPPDGVCFAILYEGPAAGAESLEDALVRAIAGIEPPIQRRAGRRNR